MTDRTVILLKEAGKKGGGHLSERMTNLILGTGCRSQSQIIETSFEFPSYTWEGKYGHESRRIETKRNTRIGRKQKTKSVVIVLIRGKGRGIDIREWEIAIIPDSVDNSGIPSLRLPTLVLEHPSDS